MGPKPNIPKSNDLFRQRLDELVNSKHPLVQLTRHIDWSAFKREWADFFPSSRGRPATAPRLVAGLLYLQHTFALSDEEVVWGWWRIPRLRRKLVERRTRRCIPCLALRLRAQLAHDSEEAAASSHPVLVQLYWQAADDDKANHRLTAAYA